MYGFLCEDKKNGKPLILYNVKDMVPVIKNPGRAGKPKLMKVSGNSMWSGMNRYTRSLMSKELKHYFYDILKHIGRISNKLYPIGIKIDIYNKLGDYDLDNMIIVYRKCITDALCGNVEYTKNISNKWIPDYKTYPPIIESDTVHYVQSIPTDFIPVEDDSQRKMVIELFSINN